MYYKNIKRRCLRVHSFCLVLKRQVGPLGRGKILNGRGPLPHARTATGPAQLTLSDFKTITSVYSATNIFLPQQLLKLLVLCCSLL